MRTLTATAAALLVSGAAGAQAPQAAPSAEASAAASVSLNADGTANASGVEASAAADTSAAEPQSSGGFDPGFETGLRVGVGTPVGKAGDAATGGDIDLKDLAPMRVPVWLDLGYRISERATLGLYGQLGFGSTGDTCVGDCDWSDLRIGVQAQWRLADFDAGVKPWLGVGLGYESLSFRSLDVVSFANEEGETDEIAVRAAERLGGPELLLELGLDFRVEDSLDVGPYLSATLGTYMTDRLKCDPIDCAGDQLISAAGFHSWLGIGLRGSYLP